MSTLGLDIGASGRGQKVKIAIEDEICLVAVPKEILSRGVKVATQACRGRGNGVSHLLVASPPWTITAPLPCW